MEWSQTGHCTGTRVDIRSTTHRNWHQHTNTIRHLDRVQHDAMICQSGILQEVRGTIMVIMTCSSTHQLDRNGSNNSQTLHWVMLYLLLLLRSDWLFYKRCFIMDSPQSNNHLGCVINDNVFMFVIIVWNAVTAGCHRAVLGWNAACNKVSQPADLSTVHGLSQQLVSAELSLFAKMRCMITITYCQRRRRRRIFGVANNECVNKSRKPVFWLCEVSVSYD